MKKTLAYIAFSALALSASAQSQPTSQPHSGFLFPDSVTVAVHSSYNKAGPTHRKLFGENYRKEWAIPVKMPVLKISQIAGGLKPLRQGGGFESQSLRLQDPSGKEWILRSVEKVPDKLLPEGLKGTFVMDWVGDEFSGQHPYSALIVPPIAAAAQIPHSNPVIGQVADDPNLGEYRKIFVGMVCLLEEREPNGPSDNTLKMERDLVKNYRNTFDKEEFLRARLVDLLIGDWDRHEDQWRWSYQENGKYKTYTAVPRDRDQVFHVTQGLFPTIASQPWLDPLLENYDGKVPDVKYSLYKTRFMRAYPGGQFTIEEWRRVVGEFVSAETDEVLKAAIDRMPSELYGLRNNELLAKMKERRDNILRAMEEYYRFINRIIDVRLSDKAEQVVITDGKSGALHIEVTGLDKSHTMILIQDYHPQFTKEVRLYLSGGDDKVVLNADNTKIKIRIIGSSGLKSYEVNSLPKHIKVYDQPDSALFTGKFNSLPRRLSSDTLNTHFVPNNPYNVWMPLLTGALNADDGFLLGVGFRYTHQNGFRTKPYADVQELMLTHSFATDAFRINYKGEWTRLIGAADLTLNAQINAPNNTDNYFGWGNQTPLNKFEGYRRFYRARYDTYQFDPSLRWQLGKGNRLSTGPSLQIYDLDQDENKGRFIQNKSVIGTYDSTSIDRARLHLGWKIGFSGNHRDNNILPTSGYYADATLQAYTGLNTDSRSYGQITGSFTYYQKINASGTFVLSDRVGGGAIVGHPAFYQALYLGGQGDLLGYLRNRFAGQDMVYNNLQARLKLFSVASYILPGQFGLSSFYDAGRVWVPGEHSDQIHQGYGGGFYFSPAGLTIMQVLAGHSAEGWYPYISLNFRI